MLLPLASRMLLRRPSVAAAAEVVRIVAATTVPSRMVIRGLSVKTLSSENSVNEFLELNSKSVLYFTASWCGPCRQIKPIYEQMSEKYQGVAFGKVDVDENSDAAVEFEISAVPTFVSFDGDDAVERFSGADPNRLETMVQQLEKQ